jgi:hypothetical protein
MTVTAGPARSQTAACLVAAVVLALVGLATDGGGRLLSWPAALLVLAVAARDLALGPALRADASGLLVVTGLRVVRLDWSSVERLRVVRDRRTPLLEVDAEGRLHLLSRWRLGRPPAAVLDELQGVAPPRLSLSR